MKKWESYLLGAFRDGSAKGYGKDYQIVIWQKERGWLERIQSILQKMLGKKVKIKRDRNGFRIKFHNKKFFQWLINNDFPKSGDQSHWRTPTNIKKDMELQRFYIAGFFDAEGGIGKYKKGNKIYLRIDFYHSWNNSFECPPLEDIKLFLENLQIKCGDVRKRKKGKNNRLPRFVLSISNLNSIRKFFELIPFCHPVKRKELAALLAEA